MTLDQSLGAAVHQEPPYRHLRPGHFVIIGATTYASTSWWMGQVICCEGSDANRNSQSFCQVTDVESGLQHWIRAGEITDVIWAMDGWPHDSTGC